MKEALYFESLSEGSVQCSLCPCLCPISPSRHGQCGVRLNRNGKLYSMTYGRVSVEEIIPIESLPLYHFYPGSKFLLIGSMGCNIHCPFCNTWRVSQSGARARLVPPKELVNLAQAQGVAGVAFGVNEPTVYIEYILDAARHLRRAGLPAVIATNGFISEAALFDLIKAADAFIVDVKGFNDSFYQHVTGGYKDEIFRNIVSLNIKSQLEVSALIIEGHNDNEAEFEQFCRWLGQMQPAPPPLHLIRYEPAFQYKNPATEPLRMYYFQELARRILPFVYLSNMDEREGKITYCPQCKAPLIVRKKDGVKMDKLIDNQCAHCYTAIPLRRKSGVIRYD